MPEQADEKNEERAGRRALVFLIVAVSAVSALYRILLHQHLGQSAAMFLGIPAVLAILLALAPKAETVTGGILKAITLALLIIAPILGEGYLCILFAAPLFYAVGIVVGLIVDWRREKREGTLVCVAVVLLPLCLEGVVPELTFHRMQSVKVSRVVTATEADVARALEQSPRVEVLLPGMLRIGFPRPLAAYGKGMDIGSTRTIHFAGAEGDPPGDLVMKVVESRPGYVRFETVSDKSKLTQWLLWRSSDVTWRKIDSRHTEVSWRIGFDRQLDPAWYFTPWERLAVSRAAEFLIEANAAPQGREGL